MKRTLILVAALALGGAAAFSWAAGVGHHGHDSTDPVAVIQSLQAQLKLNTSQQMQFDNAFAQSKAAHAGARSGFAQLKSAKQAELAKSAPDLASLAAMSDQVQQQNSGPRKQARAAWLALYDTFSTDQKLIVRDAINDRIAKAEAFRAQMRAAHGH